MASPAALANGASFLRNMWKLSSEKGKTFLGTGEHKTFDQYKELAKFLSPGTIQALLRYFETPFLKDGETLFESAKGKPSAISKLLHSFKHRYIGQGVEVDPTLDRKWHHSVLMKRSRTGKALR